MTKYKDWRYVDDKSRWVVVDETDKIINRNPTKDELKLLVVFPEENYRRNRRRSYTEEELLSYLRQFYEEYGRLPMGEDFINNSEYPGLNTYIRRFGSWNKALEKAFDIKRDYHNRGDCKKYTEEDILNELRRFDKEEGTIPKATDFINNPEYPSLWVYIERFGSWSNALKKVGLDVESMVKKGILCTNDQRFAEVIVRDHFKAHPVDLAGKNKNSPCDGMCPNGKIYDVKSSSLHNSTYYLFNINNKDNGEIEIYYLLAFNKDYTELKYALRIPAWEVVGKGKLYLGLNSNYEFNIENMKEYDITDNIKDVLGRYGLK